MCKQYYTTLTCKSAYVAKRYRSPHCEGIVRLELARIPCDLNCSEEQVGQVDVKGTQVDEGLAAYGIQREVLVAWCQECQRHNSRRKLSVIAEEMGAHGDDEESDVSEKEVYSTVSM